MEVGLKEKGSGVESDTKAGTDEYFEPPKLLRFGDWTLIIARSDKGFISFLSPLWFDCYWFFKGKFSYFQKNFKEEVEEDRTESKERKKMLKLYQIRFWTSHMKVKRVFMIMLEMFFFSKDKKMLTWTPNRDDLLMKKCYFYKFWEKNDFFLFDFSPVNDKWKHSNMLKIKEISIRCCLTACYVQTDWPTWSRNLVDGLFLAAHSDRSLQAVIKI